MDTERQTIYLCLAHMSEAGLEQKYVKEAFDTNWVVPMGPNVNAFEHDLEAFANSKSNGTTPLDRKVVCLSAGTAAVHLALIGCGVKAGDEVLVQSFTFCASSHPVTYLGAKPVFVISAVHLQPVVRCNVVACTIGTSAVLRQQKAVHVRTGPVCRLGVQAAQRKAFHHIGAYAIGGIQGGQLLCHAPLLLPGLFLFEHAPDPLQFKCLVKYRLLRQLLHTVKANG